MRFSLLFYGCTALDFLYFNFVNPHCEKVQKTICNILLSVYYNFSNYNFTNSKLNILKQVLEEVFFYTG